MLPTVTDGVAYVHWSRHAKMAELIKMSFGTWTWVGRRNHVFDGGADLPMRRNNFERENGVPLQSLDTAVSYAKTPVVIDMQSGILSRVDSWNHVSEGSVHWHDLVNTTEPYI